MINIRKLSTSKTQRINDSKKIHQAIEFQLSTIYYQLSTVNCQLSTVNCHGNVVQGGLTLGILHVGDTGRLRFR